MDQQQGKTGRLTSTVPSDDSSGSLNVNEMLRAHDSSNLLAISFSSLPSSTSTHSFGDIPDYPHARCLPLLFVNLTQTPTLLCPGSQSPSQSSKVIISVPTAPRMRIMLLEPISVARWSEQIAEFASNGCQVAEADAISEGCQPPIWKAEGSLYPPEDFQEILQERRTSRRPSTCVATRALKEEPSMAQTVDTSCYDPSVDSMAMNCSAEALDKSARSVRVPTITLSNSTAVMPMPLSLESSQCITSIAARRGCKGPAPLELPAPNINLSVNGLYPGIPTPFLGSPSAYSPKFEFAQNPSGFSMNLASMCQDLRSRCPPLHPPSPPREGPATPVSPLSDSDSSDNPASDSDSDDWAFAKDLLAMHSKPAAKKFSEDGHTTKSLSEASLIEGDPFSLDSAPTLTSSPQSDCDTSEYSALATPEQIPKDSAHQRRRRTVIIETPRSSISAKPARITVDLSHLADDSDDATPPMATFPALDVSLPVEVTPSLDFVSAIQSTPHLRPMSNATIRPIRSILKTREKKRVRFSLMPGQGGDSTDDLKSEFDDDAPESPGRGRERAATIPMCHRPSSPHHARLSLTNAFSTNRASFPKHPAVKSLKRSTQQPPDGTPTPASKSTKMRQSLQLVSRVVDKSEVGPPRKLAGHVARRSMPAEVQRCQGKRCSRNENSGKRFSEDVTLVQKTSSPQKSRMPFRSILGKFRA
ncbi:uncharacterized protein PHACADRAFT_213792 [Phanerochaete carnosa HHB-10118-sp]|uniref:Uncharacterized protein n=1 Tax=Phanerochaete carnosa (strain HHB-10118-sp) TaxID=650164 RepID=K5WIF8_PHACS|nr:uncharacterized protein PHACADRAFT_213792 [Phanerochaete carnosa HHB-10118-sp]EKM50022.1 hypothetical protein PHACADRAFT_213792 [Phanerochaete carnosa HHB-10118-sp]